MKSTPTIRSSLLLLAVGLLAAGAGPFAPRFDAPLRDARGLPPIVFVSRNMPREQLVTPGLGLAGRTVAVGGRLLVRARDGRVSELVPADSLYDVADPCVSWDGARIVFAGLAAPDSAWRLYVVGSDGRGLRALTRTDRALDLAPLGAGAQARYARYDDFDPAWLPDGRVVFASTRFPQTSQHRGVPVSNLFVVRPDGSRLERITTERNGGEEPAIDPLTGRVVYSRWLFNPYFASDTEPSGLTTDSTRGVRSDRVNHWQAVSIFPDGDLIQLAAGEPRPGLRKSAYQACVLKDGAVAVVDSELGALSRTMILWYPAGFGPATGWVGPPSIPVSVRGAASPAELPDGRIAFAADYEARWGQGSTRRDFGLYTIDRKSGAIARIVDLPDTDELDPAPLVARKVPPVLPAQGGVDDPAWTLPVTTLDQVRRMDDTFRFDCLNVYLTGPVDSPFPDAPRITKGARIRFFAALARPDAATGDTIVLVREAKLEASGAVHESDIPGDVPLFEQLVDENGRILRSAHGPAHVPGMNFSRIGSGTKCVGCHEGHSALPVPKNNFEAKWFNASPSAVVTVSSGSGASELVDRRAKGTMGWVAEAAEGQWARLTWPLAVEARSIVLYALHLDGRARTDLQVRECQLVFYRDGREVGRVTASRVRPEGTRIDFSPVRLDAIEVRPTRVTGKVDGRPAVALAEIETIARMIE